MRGVITRLFNLGSPVMALFVYILAMPLHLQKLSVGTESLQTLQDWQTHVAARRAARGLSPYYEHVTRMSPKRVEALLEGGSIYWIFKGLMQCRNEIKGLEPTQTRDGRKACSILMVPELIPVIPTPKRPFQGWRYLKFEDAPADLKEIGGAHDLPPELRAKLANLGAW